MNILDMLTIWMGVAASICGGALTMYYIVYIIHDITTKLAKKESE